MEPWSPYKELWLTIQDVIGRKNDENLSHLKVLLRMHKPSFVNLLQNPAKNVEHRSAVKKSVKEGIVLEGDPNPHNFEEDFIEESIILSDLFNLNEYSSLGLLLAGEQQLPNYPSLTRGLVAVLLFWDGRRCLVNSLKTLIQCRRGHSWTLDASEEMVSIATQFTDELLENKIVDVILKLINEIKVETEMNKLYEQRGLGNPKHRRQIRDIIEEIRLSLAECLFNYAAQSNLSLESMNSILRFLESNGETSSNGALDPVTLSLVFSVLHGFALPQEIPIEPDDNGVKLLLSHPLLSDINYCKNVHRRLQNQKEWKIPGIKSLIQFAWSLALHTLGQVPNAISELAKNNIYNDETFSDNIEADETVLEHALNGKVFLFIKECVLRCELCREEFYIRKLHDIITDLIFMMPLKIKDLRTAGDEVARIIMLHTAEGEEPPSDLRKDFLQFMEMITEMYNDDPNDLKLSSDFWCLATYSGSFLASRMQQRMPMKKAALNKFIRQAGDLLPPLLYIPFLNMLASLSRNKNSAAMVFEMLRGNGSGSMGEGSTISWDHFFLSFNKYYLNLKQEKQSSFYGNTMHSFNSSMQHSNAMQSIKGMSYSITPQEIDGLKAVLNVVTSIAAFDDNACITMYEHPQWSVGTALLGMLQCPVPTTLKASIIQALEKLARIPEIAIGILILMENLQILNTIPGTTNQGIINELEDVEAKQETYEMTQAFLKLLSVLSNNATTVNLMSNAKNMEFDHYLTFVAESVFLKLLSRAYKNPAEKWKIAWKCLQFFKKILKQYTPESEHFIQRTVQAEMPTNSMNITAFGTVAQPVQVQIPKPPGYQLLLHIMGDESVFKTIMAVIENCIKYLNSYVKNSEIEQDLVKSGVYALELLLETLNMQDEFLACMRNSGSSVLLSTVDKLLLSINPGTGKADYIISIAKFVAHNATTPKAALTAVEIIFWLARSSTATQQKIVDMFTTGCSRKVKDGILHGFVESLESGEAEFDFDEIENQDESDKRIYQLSKCRLTIVRLLLYCVNLPQPNLGHFLLGFNLNKPASQTSLQDPGVLGSPRTCLHSVLMILSGGLDYSCAVNTFSDKGIVQNTPNLTELCFQLIYKLAANIETSGPVLRYLRSSHDFVFRHVGNLPFPMINDEKSNVVLLQQAWLLKTAAIELYLTALNRQRSHTQRLIRLLFSKSDLGNLQDEPNNTTMGTLNSTALMNLSTQVIHNTTVSATIDDGSIDRSRVLKVIDNLEFSEKMPDALKLEQFVTSQVEEVIASCEITNEFGFVFCDVKMLHNLLQANVNSLRGTDDIARRELATQEVEDILKVAVQRNQTRQNMHSKLTLVTAWRHVIEIAFCTFPNDLLTTEDRQLVILDILNEILKHSLNSESTPELIAPLAPLFLTLITHLRNILIGPHAMLNSNQSVLPDMQDFNLDSILNPDANATLSVNLISPLQTIIKGMLDWLLQSNTNPKVRTHLYAALLYYLQLCQKPKSMNEKLKRKSKLTGLRVLSQDVHAKLAKDNIKLFQSYGESLMELICRDTSDGHNVCRILSFACLDAIVKIDWEQNWLQFMMKKGYITSIAHSIAQDDIALQQSLTPQPEPLSSIYIYEQKMSLLCSIVLTTQGAREVIESGLFGKLSEAQFFDLRPMSDDGNSTSFLPGMMARYRQILKPALKLCTNILATLGGHRNHEASALILEFLLAHCDALISAILRHRPMLGDIPSLNELSMVTSILSQVASQNFSDQSLYATIPQNVIIELQGHITKIQRHLLTLLPEYCLDNEIMVSVKKRFDAQNKKSEYDTVILQIHNIQANLLTYCRNMINLSKNSDPDSGILLFTLSMNLSSESNSHFYTLSNLNAPGIGLLVQILQQSVAKFSTVQNDISKLKRKLENISNLSVHDLKKTINVSDDKLTVAQRRAFCALKFQTTISDKNHLLQVLHYITENSLMILWHHLDMYILKMPCEKENELFFGKKGSANATSLNRSKLRRLQDFSNSFQSDIIQSSPERNKTLGLDKQSVMELKEILPGVLTDAFLDKVNDIERQVAKDQNTPFIQPLVRRIQRIVKLHT